MLVPQYQAHKTGVAFEYAFFLAAHDFRENAPAGSSADVKNNAKAIYDEFLASGGPREIMVRFGLHVFAEFF